MNNTVKKTVAPKKVVEKKSTKSTKSTVNIHAVVSTVDYEQFFDDLLNVRDKTQLIELCNKNNIYTVTKPTACSSDIYVQFFDGTRIKITKKSIMLYTSEWCSKCFKPFKNYIFDNVHDSDYRTHRLTLPLTIDNVTNIIKILETEIPMFHAKVD